MSRARRSVLIALLCAVAATFGPRAFAQSNATYARSRVTSETQTAGNR